jgi:cytochrome oxidase Cu insertion factor (SCO1/SenC/PrrC family)
MSWSIRSLFLVCFLLAFSQEFSSAQTHENTDATTAAAQSALQPEFIPPPPGSYTLPPIDTIGNHPLLDSTGKPVDLFSLTAGKIAIVSFMYTSCADVGGCPLAAAVLQQVDQLLEQRPTLAKQVVLLSITFDIERDHPARLAEIREGLAPHTNWHFLTNANQDDLQSVLADFNQPVAKLWREDGDWSGLFRHVLKVYLLDPQHQVRNIYSTGLFNAQLVTNDIETVVMEGRQRPTADTP